MSEPLKDVIDELVKNLRKAGCDEDRWEPGSNLAVLLHQAERMITTLAARTPGPEVAAMEACRRLVEWSESENDAEWPLIRVVTLARSFLAEHGAARPGKAG